MVGTVRILIVGGGIAGLSLGIALRRRGLDAEIVERSTVSNPAGAGIAMQPNGMRALYELGVGEAIERSGATVHRWRFCDQRGDVLCEIDLKTVWGDVGPFVGIARSRLYEALVSTDVSCRLATTVTSLSEHSDGVSVSFSHGPDRDYDLVVGADGIHSTVRQLAADTVEAVYGGQMVWRSVAPIRRSGHDRVEFWLGRNRFAGLCPVSDTHTYVFANMTTSRVRDPLAGRRERLQERFADLAGPIPDYLASIRHDTDIDCAPIEWLPAATWRVGRRVVLIGDAAHASSPMMGQGGSMAIEDAVVLADALHAAPDVDTAITDFVDRRDRRVEWVRRESLAVGDMVDQPPELRNPALRQHGKAAFHHRFTPLTAPVGTVFPSLAATPQPTN
jgi:2-polyprenyl-6-methoxyphenol hydroxylase-like FAD-dependent oxidoreductase